MHTRNKIIILLWVMLFSIVLHLMCTCSEYVRLLNVLWFVIQNVQIKCFAQASLTFFFFEFADRSVGAINFMFLFICFMEERTNFFLNQFKYPQVVSSNVYSVKIVNYLVNLILLRDQFFFEV